MKMKRLLTLLMALVLMLSLCIFAYAVNGANGYIVDTTQTLSQDAVNELDAQALELAHKYGSAVHFMLVDDYQEYATGTGKEIFDVCAEYYHSQGFGVGSGKSGILMMISKNDRQLAFFVYGNGAGYAMTDYAQDTLYDKVVAQLSEDEWQKGAEVYVDFCEEALEAAANGKPLEKSNLGVIVLIYLGAMAVAGIVCFVYCSMMNNVAKGSDATDYISAEGLLLNGSDDVFVNRVVTRREKSKKSESGGDSHEGHGGSGRSGSF